MSKMQNLSSLVFLILAGTLSAALATPLPECNLCKDIRESIGDPIAQSATFETPAPVDRNGKRIKDSIGDPVYLILDNVRRWLPNIKTYNNLFRDWKDIKIVCNVAIVEAGPQLSDGAILAKSPEKDTVYLISNGMKRGIASPAAMDKYHFEWKKIVSIPEVVLDAVPSGPVIS